MNMGFKMKFGIVLALVVISTVFEVTSQIDSDGEDELSDIYVVPDILDEQDLAIGSRSRDAIVSSKNHVNRKKVDDLLESDVKVRDAEVEEDVESLSYEGLDPIDEGRDEADEFDILGTRMSYEELKRNKRQGSSSSSTPGPTPPTSTPTPGPGGGPPTPTPTPGPGGSPPTSTPGSGSSSSSSPTPAKELDDLTNAAIAMSLGKDNDACDPQRESDLTAAIDAESRGDIPEAIRLLKLAVQGIPSGTHLCNRVRQMECDSSNQCHCRPAFAHRELPNYGIKSHFCYSTAGPCDIDIATLSITTTFQQQKDMMHAHYGDPTIHLVNDCLQNLCVVLDERTKTCHPQS